MSVLQATWYAVRATGAWPHEAEYFYTSAEPPVEAAEYDRVLAHLTAAYQENDTLVAQHNALDDQLAAALARAEAAERELAAVPVLCIASLVVGEPTEGAIEHVRLWLAQQGEVQP